MRFVFGALLATVSLAMSARAQSNVVYAVEFNQSPNRFGAVDLWTGNFIQIATFGTLINDLAYCPTNGMLYGILNSTTLVTFNETNGAITSIGNFNVGIQSLAFRPSDGVLFGATQTGLYTINPATGAATPVGSGSFGGPPNLNNQGQNIRFAQDGNLYISNTSMNTDIYRISTADGSATWMGEAVGIPYLMLMNGDNYMYGVYINLGSSSGPQNTLTSFDLASFVEGGTNADGSTHQISLAQVGAGTNFPINFIFSGNVSQPVTNLTVPVSAVGPSDQTAVVGSNVVFSTTASGTGPYNYAWLENGAAISGQTNSSLTLNNVTTSQAGIYTVIVNGAAGSVTNSATLTVTKASATVTLGNLGQVYDGTARSVTAGTTPTGLTVNLTYNGLANAPTNAGSYTVIGTINDANYQGSATNMLVINKATLNYTANGASMTYGSAVPGLSGSVSGFVGTDNPGNATMGTLTFTTLATSSSGVGGYAINGAGLTANNGNYTFVQAAGNATALTINALPVNLTGTRSYDGTPTVAAGILSVANEVGGDNVMVVSGSGTLAGAKVGSEAIMTFGTLALGGTAAGNYTLAGAGGSVNITVSALGLTVTNLLAEDKVYDGTTNATLDATDAGLTGVLNGDDVTLVSSNAVAYYADKHADTNKPVTVTGLALGGAAAANYTLVDPTNVTANITAAGLTVNGVAAVSKVYDGTTNAQLNGTVTLNGAVKGDDVSLVTDDVSAAFASPNVGTDLPVTVSGYAIAGADAGNYTLTPPSGLAADITAAALTITATPNAKIYDSTTSAAAIPTTSGLQGNDTVTGLAETYDTPDAGTGKTLSVSAYAVNDGNGGNNYTVSTVTSTGGVINKAPSSISLGGLSQTYDGTAKAATAGTTPSGLTVALTYNGSANAPINAGSYTVIGTINNANYQGGATNPLVIAPVTLTVTADNKAKIYGMTNPPLTASYTGFVGGENTNVLLSPVTLSTMATTTSGAGMYPITAGGATAANYTIQYVNGTLRVISAPPLAIAGVSVNGTEQYVVSWQTITNQMYQLEYTADLNPPEHWTPLGSPFAGTDGLVAVTNAMKVMPNCFFRVEVQ